MANLRGDFTRTNELVGNIIGGTLFLLAMQRRHCLINYSQITEVYYSIYLHENEI